MLGDCGPRQLAPDRAVDHHQHAIAAPDEFVNIGRIEQDRRARLRELAQKFVELLLGADVDATRRIVQKEVFAATPSAICR